MKNFKEINRTFTVKKKLNELQSYLTRLRGLMLTLIILCSIGSGNVWGADVVYKTAKFGSSYNSASISGYTSSWYSTYNGFRVDIANGNNNSNKWEYIKFGRSGTASVGTITTNAAIAPKVTKISITIDAITAAKINNITLSISSNGSSWTNIGTYSKSTGTQTVNIPAANQAANLYYKLTFDCASGSSNGLITISQVDYYADEANFDRYTLVTDASTLAVGDVIVFGASAYGIVAGVMSSNFLTAVSGTFNDGTLYTSGALEFTLSKSGNNWIFTNSSKQLRATSTSALSLATSGGYDTWSISISSNNATITSSYASYGTLQYNSDSPRFRNYTSSQKVIQIYRKEAGCSDPTAATKGTFNRSTQVMPINWTSAAGKVDVCYSTSSTTPGATPSASYTVVSDQNSSPVNLNVADKAAGNYYCWVRSVCDAENKSDWVAITGNYFTIPTHTLTVTATPSGSGTFTKSPNVTSVVEGRTVSITANPAAGYVFSSWAVSGTDATLSSTTTNPTTFTMGTANATVTATFTAKPLNSIILAQTEAEIYDQQYVQIGVSYDPADIITKGYTLTGPDLTKVVTTGSTQTQLKISATKAGVIISEEVSETVSIKANADETKTASVTVTIKPLPKVHFVDIVHGYEFADVVGTIEDNVLVADKTTPTHDSYSGTGANDCETDHTRLVGWIEKTWADTHPDASHSDIIGAGTGVFIEANAAINVLTYNGNTYYAVWAKLQ